MNAITKPAQSFLAVIDIGKTNAKVVIIDTQTREEIDYESMVNKVIDSDPYPHYQTDELWQFFLASLQKLNLIYPIKDLIVITHGAAAALVDENLALVLPVVDYEYTGPEKYAAAYDAIRPDYSETGSPKLAAGLNVGAQLYWQQQQFPEVFSQAKYLLMYPQYWSAMLSGVLVNEATSLGCHTDLWQPKKGCYSSLVETLQLERLMPPIKAANDCLGKIQSSVAAATGLSLDTNVYCGIHDSNASLCTYLGREEGEFTVLSTGTWVIAISVMNEIAELDEKRDTLMNVNVYGKPVPSARFMGGREYERVTEGRNTNFNKQDILSVLHNDIMILPAIESQTGPFQGYQYSWTAGIEELSDAQVTVAISFYLALMTATSLEIINAAGMLFIEGPFGQNQLYRDMLSAATQRTVKVSNADSTGTSLGALQLLYPKNSPKEAHQYSSEASSVEQAYQQYATAWFQKQAAR